MKTKLESLIILPITLLISFSILIGYILKNLFGMESPFVQLIALTIVAIGIVALLILSWK